jgi:hypothetical protein
MLAAVHISIWTAIKHDRKVSRDVADQHGAHQGAGRYNKQLLRGADKLDELRTLAGQIRQHFYKITLPWSDEGFRLLPANFYFDLMARMREFEAGFEQGVESFLRVYRSIPSYQLKRRVMLDSCSSTINRIARRTSAATLTSCHL